MSGCVITHLGAQGDGVAGRLFVPGTAPGDTVQIDETGRVARIDAGPNHVAPPCGHFGACGGCTLQHVAMPAYAQWLGQRIDMALRQHGISAGHVEFAHVSPLRSRRRLVMKALRTTGAVVLGFSRRHAHALVDVEDCLIADPRLCTLLAPLRALLMAQMAVRQAAGLHMTATETGVDLVITDHEPADMARRQQLTDFALAHNLARLSVRGRHGMEVIVERASPQLTFGGVAVRLPVESFTQATADGEQAMIAAVCASLTGARVVADLFCGIGTFALPLSQQARVLAVDAARDAVFALKQAADSAGRQVRTEHRDLFRRPLRADELCTFDAVVFDPPRAGAEAQSLELARSSVESVVALSCNPNTFARDAAHLVAGGFRLEQLWPVGQFLWSTHVELVARFTR